MQGSQKDWCKCSDGASKLHFLLGGSNLLLMICWENPPSPAGQFHQRTGHKGTCSSAGHFIKLEENNRCFKVFWKGYISGNSDGNTVGMGKCTCQKRPQLTPHHIRYSGFTSKKACWENSWAVLTPIDSHLLYHKTPTPGSVTTFHWNKVPQMSCQNRPGATFKLCLAAVNCVHLNIFYRITEHSEVEGTYKGYLLNKWLIQELSPQP